MSGIDIGDDDVSILVENPQAMSQEIRALRCMRRALPCCFYCSPQPGNAAALLEEAESGTLDRILVSKAGLFHIISGKWLGIFLLGCLQLSVMFLWAEMIFRIQLWKHLDGFVVMTVSTAAATSSFAMLMATLCRSTGSIECGVSGDHFEHVGSWRQHDPSICHERPYEGNRQMDF